MEWDRHRGKQEAENRCTVWVMKVCLNSQHPVHFGRDLWFCWVSKWFFFSCALQFVPQTEVPLPLYPQKKEQRPTQKSFDATHFVISHSRSLLLHSRTKSWCAHEIHSKQGVVSSLLVRDFILFFCFDQTKTLKGSCRVISGHHGDTLSTDH